MGVADDVVSKMNGLAEAHVRLRRSLQADDQVEHHRHGGEPQGWVPWQPAGAALGQHQITHNYDDNQSQHKRREDSGGLGRHWNHGEDIVVGTIQRIKKKQPPETQHG